jgi:hypothetical protein
MDQDFLANRALGRLRRYTKLQNLEQGLSRTDIPQDPAHDGPGGNSLTGGLYRGNGVDVGRFDNRRRHRITC